MSVLIKGVELPKSCYECFLCDDECFGSYKCGLVKEWGSAESRASDCPIVEIPPHGRLIDADALKPGFIGSYAYTNWSRYAVINAPTIIEAEE